MKSRRIPIILTQWIFTARFRPYDQVSMSFHRCCGRHSMGEEIGFMRDIIQTIQHYVCLWQRCGRGYVLYRSRCMSSFCLPVYTNFATPSKVWQFIPHMNEGKFLPLFLEVFLNILIWQCNVHLIRSGEFLEVLLAAAPF